MKDFSRFVARCFCRAILIPSAEASLFPALPAVPSCGPRWRQQLEAYLLVPSRPPALEMIALHMSARWAWREGVEESREGPSWGPQANSHLTSSQNDAHVPEEPLAVTAV